jgi:group I intron endonuclease
MTIAAYILTDPISGFEYYGSSENVEVRLDRHFRDLQANQHHNSRLQELYNAGRVLDKIIFESSTIEDARETELAFINSHQGSWRMMNIGLGVNGGDNLSNHPERERIISKISESVRTRMAQMSPEDRKEKWGRPGASNPMFGRTHSEEVRLASSKLHRGNTHALGNEWSPEARAKLSKIASERTGDKNPFFGKTHSAESREKIRQAKLGGGPPTNAMKVMVKGIVYNSVKDACDGVGISYPTMAKRLKSDDPDYSFVS